MQNELKVFYKTDKGLMTYDGKKIIFQHRDSENNAKEGLGVISLDDFYDKGNYSFAVFKNVKTIMPEQYNNIKFFANRGVPLKIEKGIYGDSVLLKETYKNRAYIRAYKLDGTIGLFECNYIKNEKFEGTNIFFSRLDNGLIEWIDITSEVVSKILQSIQDLVCVEDLSNSIISNALKGINSSHIYRLNNGVIVADGKYESLIIWTEESDVKMAWLGRKYSDNAEILVSE